MILGVKTNNRKASGVSEAICRSNASLCSRDGLHHRVITKLSLKFHPKNRVILSYRSLCGKRWRCVATMHLYTSQCPSVTPIPLLLSVAERPGICIRQHRCSGQPEQIIVSGLSDDASYLRYPEAWPAHPPGLSPGNGHACPWLH